MSRAGERFVLALQNQVYIMTSRKSRKKILFHRIFLQIREKIEKLAKLFGHSRTDGRGKRRERSSFFGERATCRRCGVGALTADSGRHGTSQETPWDLGKPTSRK
jgi:hypothetical protein